MIDINQKGLICHEIQPTNLNLRIYRANVSCVARSKVYLMHMSQFSNTV